MATTPGAPFNNFVAQGYVQKRLSDDPVQNPATESKFYIRVTSMPADIGISTDRASIGKRADLDFATGHKQGLKEGMLVGFTPIPSPSDNVVHATQLQLISMPDPAPR